MNILSVLYNAISFNSLMNAFPMTFFFVRLCFVFTTLQMKFEKPVFLKKVKIELTFVHTIVLK